MYVTLLKAHAYRSFKNSPQHIQNIYDCDSHTYSKISTYYKFQMEILSSSLNTSPYISAVKYGGEYLHSFINNDFKINNFKIFMKFLNSGHTDGQLN